MIDCKFVNGDIPDKYFWWPPERPQEIAQSCPAAFIGIDVYLPNTIPIGIPCPFIFTATNGVPGPLELVIAVRLIGIQSGRRLGKPLDKWTQGWPCVFFSTRSRICRDVRPMTAHTGGRSLAQVPRPAPSAPFVGPLTRWINRVGMPLTFSPAFWNISSVSTARSSRAVSGWACSALAWR